MGEEVKVRGLQAKALVGLVLFGALALGGCGGGGDASTSAASSAKEQRSTNPEASATTTEKSTASTRGTEDGAKKESPPPKPKSPRITKGPLTDPSPLPNQGTKEIAPEVPTAKGGDNSIQSYGVEAESTERIQAAQTAKAYLDAQAAGRWSEACSYLSAEMREKLKALGEQAKDQSKKGCAEATAFFLAKVPQAPLRTVADIDVLSMRAAGSKAFLIYKDGEGTPAEMLMEQEGGAWKVAVLVGNGLPL